MNDLAATIAYDCRFYLGDRPCKWHKKEVLKCKCEHYSPLRESMLIIKLDAVGDVLRTTCLLPGILKKWPYVRITWITRPESVPLLENNPYFTEIIPYGPDALTHLAIREFDYVVNLDAGKISSGMASLSNGKEKIGYILDARGYVTATNKAAEDWLLLGVYDDLKKANRATYQDKMCSILDYSTEGMEYVLELTNREIQEGRDHLFELGVDLNKKIVGIHTGGGGRWKLKQWYEENFVSLIGELIGQYGDKIQMVLFGGPLEGEQNKRIVEKIKNQVFDAGCDNSLRHFASLIKCCSVVLSGDSLAMHIALAMKRRVIVLFGPTSHNEIELFGLGEKIVPDLDCLVCYKQTCDYSPNCMESISVKMVKDAIQRQLEMIS